MDEAKNQINDLKHKEEKKIQSDSKKKKTQKKDRLKSLWDTFTTTNILVIEEEKEKEIVNPCEKK